MAEARPNRTGRRLVLALVIAAFALAFLARYNRVRLAPDTEPTTLPVSEG